MYIVLKTADERTYFVGPFKKEEAEKWIEEVKKDRFFDRNELFSWYTVGPLTKAKAIELYGKRLVIPPTKPTLLGEGGILRTIEEVMIIEEERRYRQLIQRNR